MLGPVNSPHVRGRVGIWKVGLSHIDKIQGLECVYKACELLLLSPIGFGMEPHLILYTWLLCLMLNWYKKINSNTWTCIILPQLHVPGCTSLTPEGVMRAVTTIIEGSNCLTSIKINGVNNLSQQHLQALESNLPKSQDWKQRFYHKYANSSFQGVDEDPALPKPRGQVGFRLC